MHSSWILAATNGLWPCKISRFLKQPKVELFPNGSSHPASQIKTDIPPAAQILMLITPISAKTQKQQTTAGGWVLRSGRGQLRETGSIPAALPAISTATSPRQHRPKDLSKPRRDQVLWRHQTSEPAERRKGTAQRLLQHLSKAPPLLSTSSFWVWVAPSKTLTL